MNLCIQIGNLWCQNLQKILAPQSRHFNIVIRNAFISYKLQSPDNNLHFLGKRMRTILAQKYPSKKSWEWLFSDWYKTFPSYLFLAMKMTPFWFYKLLNYLHPMTIDNLWEYIFVGLIFLTEEFFFGKKNLCLFCICDQSSKNMLQECQWKPF